MLSLNDIGLIPAKVLIYILYISLSMMIFFFENIEVAIEALDLQ